MKLEYICMHRHTHIHIEIHSHRDTLTHASMYTHTQRHSHLAYTLSHPEESQELSALFCGHMMFTDI